MGLSSDPGCWLGEPFPPRRPAPSCVELQQVGCLVVRDGTRIGRPRRGTTLPSLTSSPAYDCQPRRAPRCSASSAYNQPSTPHKGTRPLGNGSPVPAGSNAVCPLEQLNIYIDVAFPSPSAPVALSSDLSVYAWIHPSDYDSEKKRKRKEKKKGRMYLEMLVRRFLTHPVGVLDSSPLLGLQRGFLQHLGPTEHRF